MSKKIENFEEAFRVVKIDENNYVGAHPLRAPVKMARGIYGGHMCAQALLVAMESVPGFIPHSFHSYFIAPGNPKTCMSYKVSKLHSGRNYTSMSIEAFQDNKPKLRCMVSLKKRSFNGSNKKVPDLQENIPKLHAKYPDPSQLHVVHHTDYIRNAYSDEFIDHSLVPEEADQVPSERWITVFSGIDQKTLFKDPRFNYVGLADLSDSALLTTLVRVLHLSWNRTENSPIEDYDPDLNALNLLNNSFNIIQLYHYNAMSLDHHIYFHCDDYESAFDVCRDWLTFSYQYKRLSNNRALVRAHLYNKDGKNVATVIQEGLVFFQNGVPDQVKL